MQQQHSRTPLAALILGPAMKGLCIDTILQIVRIRASCGNNESLQLSCPQINWPQLGDNAEVQ